MPRALGKSCPPQGGLAMAIKREIAKNARTQKVNGSVAVPPGKNIKRQVYVPVEVVKHSASQVKLRNHLIDELNNPVDPSTAQELAVRAKILNHLAYLSSPRASLTSPRRSVQEPNESSAPPSPPRSPKPRSAPPMPFLRTSADLADIKAQIKVKCDSPSRASKPPTDIKRNKGVSAKRRPNTASGSRSHPPSMQGMSLGSMSHGSLLQLSPPRRVAQSAPGGRSPTRISSRKEGPLAQQLRSSKSEVDDIETGIELTLIRSDDAMIEDAMAMGSSAE